MAGKGTISVSQTAQYGDKNAIQKLKQGMTTTPMTGNPIAKPTAGRPQGSTTAPQQGADLPLPTVHQEALDDLARKAWAAQAWQQMVRSPQAGPYVRMYAEAAMKRYQQAAMRVKNRTPYFG